MGIIQCTTGKDKNNILNLIEKSINNKQSTLDKKIYDEYYLLKDLIKPAKKIEKILSKENEDKSYSIIHKKFNFITPKKRMKFFTKWYIMSHPNQITKNKGYNSDSKIRENKNFYNSSNLSFTNKDNLRTSTEKHTSKFRSDEFNEENLAKNKIEKIKENEIGKLKDGKKVNFSSDIQVNKKYSSSSVNPNWTGENNEKVKEKDLKSFINTNTTVSNNSNNIPNKNGNFRTNIARIPQANKSAINTSNINNASSLMKIKIMKNQDSVKIISNLQESDINKQNTNQSESSSKGNDKRSSFENTVNNNISNNNNNSDQLSNRSNDRSITTGRAKTNLSKSNTTNKEDANSNNYKNNYNSSIENEALSNSICQNFNIFDDSNIIESNLRLFYEINKDKFLKRIAKGPPSSFRWISWIIASDLPLERSLDYYNYLLSLPIDSKTNLQIKKDMNRTLCGIKLSNSVLDDSQLILYNTLRAFAQVDKEVSYCQGMNFIVGFLLLMSDFNELETFYLMMSIFSNTYRDKLGIRGFFLEGFPLGNFYVEMFLFLFEKQLPELKDHFFELGVHEEGWVSKWFRTLFTLNLPFEFVMRIWDCVFVHGLEFILNFTLAFMKYMEKDLLKMNDLFDVLDYFKKMGPFYLVENEGDTKLIEESINFLQSFDIEEIIRKALKIKIDKNLIKEKMVEYEINNNVSFEKIKMCYCTDYLNLNNDKNTEEVCNQEELKNQNFTAHGINNEFCKISTLKSKNSNEMKYENVVQNPQNDLIRENSNNNIDISPQMDAKEIEIDNSVSNQDCLENSDCDSDFKEGIDDKISRHTFKTNIKKLQVNNKYK